MILSRPRQAAEQRLIVLFSIALLTLAIAALSHCRDSRVPSTPPRARAIDPTGPAAVDRWLAVIERTPSHSYAHAQLGLTYLARVRATGDTSLYALAERAFDEALAHNPDQFDARLGLAHLALARHDFAAALAWAEAAHAQFPLNSDVLAVLVDAQIELGAYTAARESVLTLNNLKPGLPAFTRLSYVAELYGDSERAISAMEAAVATAVPGTEAWLWSVTQLGGLHFRTGDWEEADLQFARALMRRADYPYALAGQAQTAAARGDLAAAIATLETLIARYPLPEFVQLLGELYHSAGRFEEANEQYALVRTIQRLNSAGGQNVALEMAAFEAEHGDPAVALNLARSAYATHPTIHAADAFAWALYLNGDTAAAWARSQEALRLGTRDATMIYHAGIIAVEGGHEEQGYRLLAEALALNPAFDPLDAPRAAAILARSGK